MQRPFENIQLKKLRESMKAYPVAFTLSNYKITCQRNKPNQLIIKHQWVFTVISNSDDYIIIDMNAD